MSEEREVGASQKMWAPQVIRKMKYLEYEREIEKRAIHNSQRRLNALEDILKKWSRTI